MVGQIRNRGGVPGAGQASTHLPLPRWFPRRFNLQAAARGARAVLESQGMTNVRYPRLTFTDVDLTLLATTAGDRVVDGRGRPVIDPQTGRQLITSVGGNHAFGDDLDAFQARYPQVDVSEFSIDESEWDDTERLARERPIPNTTALLANKAPDEKQIVLTARFNSRIIDAMKQKLGQSGVAIDGVFLSYNGRQAERMGLPDNAPTAVRKALTMAATIAAYDPAGADVKTVRYMEDSDANMKAAMQLLPKLFPNKKFEFIDVISRGNGQFEPVVIARSGSAPGQLVDGNGQNISDQAIADYESPDVPVRRP